jgi:HAD superfamily hydrolase (TIGR01662 family)
MDPRTIHPALKWKRHCYGCEMLSAALVDVGGTLWPDRWPGYDAARRRRLSVALRVQEPVTGNLVAELDMRDPAARLDLTQDTSRMIVESLEACELPSDPNTVQGVLDAMTIPARGSAQLFPGATQLLKAIKDLGLHCVIFSNTSFRSADAYRRDFETAGVAQFIDAIISSVDTGYRKPSPHMFAAAIAASSSRADQCCMIGDSELKDIVPAASLGMMTIKVAHEGAAPEESSASATVTSLVDAAAVLRSWSKKCPTKLVAD